MRTGAPFHVTIPGGGALLDAGRVRIDGETGDVTFSDHFGFFSGELGAFCAALA